MKGDDEVKKIISGCIDQVVQFDTEQELEKLLEHLESRKQRYSIIWKNVLNDGKVMVRIRRQYNGYFMEGGDK